MTNVVEKKEYDVTKEWALGD